MRPRAFVSSTFLDLQGHRGVVIAALATAGINVDPMEVWPPDGRDPKTVSLDRVDECDLFVLLVGFRRGHVPAGESLSITQQEYERAVVLKKDILVFMLHDESPWLARFDERQTDVETVQWRSALKDRHTITHFDLAKESLDIGPAIARWAIEQRNDVTHLEPSEPADAVISLELVAQAVRDAVQEAFSVQAQQSVGYKKGQRRKLSPGAWLNFGRDRTLHRVHRNVFDPRAVPQHKPSVAVRPMHRAGSRFDQVGERALYTSTDCMGALLSSLSRFVSDPLILNQVLFPFRSGLPKAWVDQRSYSVLSPTSELKVLDLASEPVRQFLAGQWTDAVFGSNRATANAALRNLTDSFPDLQGLHYPLSHDPAGVGVVLYLDRLDPGSLTVLRTTEIRQAPCFADAMEVLSLTR